MTTFENRRMVIFAGPHKSASSSVQELFMKHASSQTMPSEHHPSLRNWTWPWNPRRRSYLPRKGFAPLVVEQHDTGFVRLLWNTLQEVWAGNDTHLIWGTEELDRFGTTPWSHRDGIKAIADVLDVIRPQHLDIVVNFRRPRRDQWISIWKQLTRATNGETSYANFLCNPAEQIRIWEYLDCVANPLGFVKALVDSIKIPASAAPSEELLPTVHLLNMEGIADIGCDVGHILACQVLKVPCTSDHWLPNIERPIIQNAKSGNPGLSETQMESLEWILRQRDCAYQKDLQQATEEGRLKIHQGDTIWNDCVALSSSTEALLNTTYLLQLLQSQVDCGSLSSNAIHDYRYDKVELQKPQAQRNPTTLTNHAIGTNKEQNSKETIQTPKAGGFQREREFGGFAPEDSQTAQIHLFILYCITILGFVFFLRHFKCRNFYPQRRLAGRRRVWAGRN